MTKIYALVFATAVTAAVLAVPVYSQDIVVTSDRSVNELVTAVSKDLDRRLARETSRMGSGTGEGIVMVRFQSGGDGKPDNVAIFRRSGDLALDQAALRSVRRLSSLHPLPAGIADGQIFQANIVAANDNGNLERLRRTVAREEKERIARGGSERMVFAFGLTTAAMH